ncbi:MAG TPA: pilus assembly protein TadG-related protein [Acidimicrobiia bacterium]|nr:pilus assembly protein TadG-related protein [Acidimicrobiia bacterium]
MALVGVCLAVLLGLAGMAVDLGMVYVERRELRNGADAAALAIAEDCGMGARPCDNPTALSTADEYADANAGDDDSAVESVNLTLTGPTTGSVRVVTSAWDAAAGQAGVRVPLMSLLGFDRVNVGAAATAIFDHPASQGGIPLIIGKCEFCTAIGGCPPELGMIFGPGTSATFVFKDPSKDPSAPCPADPAGKDAPGSFGWLDTDGTMCWVETEVELPMLPADPGVSPSTGCDPADLLRILASPVLIPIYSDICKDPEGTQCEDGDAGGSNTYYRVPGWASFQLTGYYLGGQYRHPNGFSCDTNSADRCIQGYFTKNTVYTGKVGGQNFGVVLVKLTE